MNTSVKPIPAGFHTANVYLIVNDAAKQIAFLEQALGAKETHRSVLPDGNIIHAEMKIGDSTIMLGQANQQHPARPATTYLYVDDVDGTFGRALQAGGKSLAEPKDQFYGDRSGGLEDPCGNYWWIATHIEDVSHEEADRRFAEMAHQH
jgi:uncharacterized glyoxalase superfamily protein PhnB